MTRPDDVAGPARNRVDPTGEIVATTVRGAWMGNRGRLHEGSGTRDIVRHHQSTAWITCALSFRDRRLPQWQPNHYTQLFFLDEAVALAAGHRPCAECRRTDFNAFRDAWASVHDGVRPLAKEMDAQLHRERYAGRGLKRQTHRAAWADLPTGAFVVVPSGLAVVTDDGVTEWDEPAHRYGRHRPRPHRGGADVLTPASTVAVLRAGYALQLDESAWPAAAV